MSLFGRIGFIFAVWFLSAFGNSNRTNATPRFLDFKQAIEMAISQSPDLNSALRQKEIRDLERSNAYSQFLPRFDLGVKYGLEGTEPRLKTTPNATPWSRSY